MYSDKLLPAMSLSGLAGVWVMYAPGFEKEECGDICTVSVLIFCFHTVHNESNSVIGV